jgi:hypothetical protein
MNQAKHPQYIIDLPAENAFLFAAEDRTSELAVATLLAAGIDPCYPVYTRDGDRVRLIAVDPFHQFPIVGEVVDFGAETTWLARWSASGVYASTSADARKKHSLDPNAPRGTISLYTGGKGPQRIAPGGEAPAPKLDEFVAEAAPEGNFNHCPRELGPTPPPAVTQPISELKINLHNYADCPAIPGERFPNRGPVDPVAKAASRRQVESSPQLIALAKQNIIDFSLMHQRHGEVSREAAQEVATDLSEARAEIRAAYDRGEITEQAYVYTLAHFYTMEGRLLVEEGYGLPPYSELKEAVGAIGYGVPRVRFVPLGSKVG